MSMFESEKLPVLSEEQRAEIEAAATGPTMGSRIPHFEELEPAAPWDTIPPHVRDGLGAYFEHGRRVGTFLHAVLENDLMTAVIKADDINLRSIREIVRFVYNYAPPQSHGSPELVAEWRESGGLAGKMP